jgi:hypothetical protein
MTAPASPDDRHVKQALREDRIEGADRFFKSGMTRSYLTDLEQIADPASRVDQDWCISPPPRGMPCRSGKMESMAKMARRETGEGTSPERNNPRTR